MASRVRCGDYCRLVIDKDVRPFYADRGWHHGEVVRLLKIMQHEHVYRGPYDVGEICDANLTRKITVDLRCLVALSPLESLAMEAE